MDDTTIINFTGRDTSTDPLTDLLRKGGTRKRTQRFSAMLSHYVIGDRYGRPGKGNDKGKVEGLVGYARRNLEVVRSI